MSDLSNLIEEVTIELADIRQPPGMYDFSPTVMLGRDYVMNTSMGVVAGVEQHVTSLHSQLKAICDDPRFSSLGPNMAPDGFMVFTANSSGRMNVETLVVSVFAQAARRCYLLNPETSNEAYVATCLAAFEELFRALAGEDVTCLPLNGLPYLQLDPGQDVATPWGTLRSAPRLGVISLLRWSPQTTCLLIGPERKVKTTFVVGSNPPFPEHAHYRPSAPVPLLLRLALALSSPVGQRPIAPSEKWTTTLVPFGPFTGFQQPDVPDQNRLGVNFTAAAPDLLHWAELISKAPPGALDLVMRMLISAISQRIDARDSLVDAVIAWEGLVGTDSELTYRVSASLAKLIETDVGKRRAVRKELANIYGLRSRLVHGRAVGFDKLSVAAENAIDYTIAALKCLYEMGEPWTTQTSEARSDALLLELP